MNVYDAAGDPTTEVAAIIQRLGVNISDLSDLPALFQQFHKAGLTAADAIKIFGLEGAGAAQILARLAPDLQTLTGPVSSGYRCAAHNQRVSNTKASAHTFGIAIDLRLSGERAYRVVTAAAAYDFTGIGVQQKGPHEKRFIHLDTLSPKEGPSPAVWSYP